MGGLKGGKEEGGATLFFLFLPSFIWGERGVCVGQSCEKEKQREGVRSQLLPSFFPLWCGETKISPLPAQTRTPSPF